MFWREVLVGSGRGRVRKFGVDFKVVTMVDFECWC